MKRLLVFLFSALLLFSTYPQSTNAATPVDCSFALKTKKVMWDKAELKQGQIGRLTVLQDTSLYKLDGDKKIIVRTLKKGEFYRIYAFKPGMLSVGGGLYVNRDNKVKYETPSKAKLSALNCIKNINMNVTRGFTTYSTIDQVLKMESATLTQELSYMGRHFKSNHFGQNNVEIFYHFNKEQGENQYTIDYINYEFTSVEPYEFESTIEKYTQLFRGLLGDDYVIERDSVNNATRITWEKEEFLVTFSLLKSGIPNLGVIPKSFQIK